MPIPKPKPDEPVTDFISRCMSHDVMKSEYSDTDQRYAVCMSSWRKVKKVKQSVGRNKVWNTLVRALWRRKNKSLDSIGERKKKNCKK